MGAARKRPIEILDMPIHGELVPMTPWRRVRRFFILGRMRCAPVLRPVGRAFRRAAAWVVFGFLWSVCEAIHALLRVLFLVGGGLLFGAAALAMLAFGVVLLGALIAWVFHITSAVQPLIQWGERAVAGVFAVAFATWLLGSLASFLAASIERLGNFFARRAGLPGASPPVVEQPATAPMRWSAL